MRGKRLRALAAAAVVAAAVGAAGPACPSRDLPVFITTEGSDTLINACETFPNVCSLTAMGCTPRVLCEIDATGTCALRNACQAGSGNPTWTPEVSMGIQVLLVQFTPTTLTIQSASECVTFNPRRCLLNPSNVHGCANAFPDSDTCINQEMVQAVNMALGSGVSFSGFTSTDGVALAVAFFQKDVGGSPVETCDGGASTLVNPCDCLPAQLTAVAGLSELSGSSTFDITCASCQNGSHDAIGLDNGSCPDIPTTDASSGECFLLRVENALTIPPGCL